MRTRVTFAFGSSAAASEGRTRPSAGAAATALKKVRRFTIVSPLAPASDRRDAINLDEHAVRDRSHGNGRAHRRVAAEAADIRFVHARKILDVGQVDVDLQDLLHRRTGELQRLLDLIE